MAIRRSHSRLVITAGIGSDHTDLQAAIERSVTVAEVTYCNSISVSEHVVMMILALARNYIPSYQWVVRGGWNIADCAMRSYGRRRPHWPCGPAPPQTF
jgi:formate dehydrogenase